MNTKMNIDQFLWYAAVRLQLNGVLAERDGTVRKVDDIATELALLFVWKHLSENRPELDLPSLPDVFSGKLNLQDAYKKIDSQIGNQIGGFKRSSFVDDRYYTAGDAVDWIVPSNNNNTITFLKELHEARSYSLKDIIFGLYRFADGRYDSGLETLLPEELVNLVLKLSLVEGREVYAPFPASMPLALLAAINGSSVTYEAATPSVLCQALAILSGVNPTIADPLNAPSAIDGNQLKQFERVVMSPPFGVRFKKQIPDRFGRLSHDCSNGDVLALEHALSQCSSRLVSLAPMGFLFRGGHDYQLRAKLVKKGWLDAVIQLPGRLLSLTPISTAILIIDKNRDPHAPTLFYDADQPRFVETSGSSGKGFTLANWNDVASDVISKNDSEFGVFVHGNDIAEDEFDFSVRKYVLGKASRGVKNLKHTRPLGQIADLVRAQLLKEDSHSHGEDFCEVGVKDIGEDGVIRFASKTLRLDGKMRDRARLQQLQPGDILLVTKGSVGKVGIVGDECGNNWVASQSYQVVRLRSPSDIIAPEYLLRYLASPLIHEYLSEQATGSNISVLKTKDIKELPIPVLAMPDQKNVLEAHEKILSSYQEIESIKQRIDGIRNAFWAL